MKHFTPNLLIYIFIGFLISSCGFGEEMTDRTADSPEGMDKSYVINLDDTDESVANDVWDNLMKEHKSKVMRIKGSNVRLAKNVAIAGLPGDLTIKSRFEQSGDNTEMRLWFVDGKKYMTPQSDPAAYDIIDRFIDKYFTTLQTRQIQNQVEVEQNKLEDLEKELKKIRKDNEKLHDNITKAEQSIKENRIKIEENLQSQDQMANKIQEQRKVINQTQSKISGINN